MSRHSQTFLVQNVEPLERLLLAHPIGALFTGELYTPSNDYFPDMDLNMGNAELLRLTPTQIGRLFLAPNSSLVTVRALQEQSDGTPKGVHVSSSNPYLQADELATVVAYQEDDCQSIAFNGLFIARLMLASAAPARLVSVGFGLMACTAYRLGFDKIKLFAARRGVSGVAHDDDLIGYKVWPKLGFDAPLATVDLQAVPHLAGCRSIQDVMEKDPDWWLAHGCSCQMQFDIGASSRSWRVLLNYLFNRISGGA